MQLTALLIVARATHIAASILITGIFTFDVITLGLGSPPVNDGLRVIEQRLLRLAVWSLVVAVLSGLLWFWLEVANMGGSSLASAFSARAWQTVLLQTRFGHIWQLRLSLIAVAFVASLGVTQDEARRRSMMLVLWFLSVMLLVALAWISHAAATSVQPLGLFGDALHLFAAGAWIGGLVPLAIFLTHTHVSLSLRERAFVVLKRFSTLSLCCVGVLVVSGVCNSCLLVGSIHGVFTTTYGWLLVCKLILFGILISLGARNRLATNTKLVAQTDSDLLSQVRRDVISETCLGAAVVAIVACLGVTAPPQPP